MKAKQQPVFAPSIRAVFRASAPSLQQIPRNFKGSVADQQRQLDKATRLGLGFSQGVERFKALAADPQVQEITKTFAGNNPGGKLLASTSGTITALKSIRETAAGWYVTYYGEGDKEVRISKTDPRRRVFDTMEEAEQWASGEHPGIALIPASGRAVE